MGPPDSIASRLVAPKDRRLSETAWSDGPLRTTTGPRRLALGEANMSRDESAGVRHAHGNSQRLHRHSPFG